MPGTHKVRDLYRLLVRVERLKSKNTVPAYEAFFEVIVCAIRAIIELSEAQLNAKLSRATERRVTDLFSNGATYREISHHVGVAPSTVWKILKKKGLFKNRPRSKQLHLFPATTLPGDDK